MKTKIYNQHSEHTEWLNKLAFYKDEIGIIQNRLEEVGSKNTGKDVMLEVEHFQNQLMIQEENIHKISHHISRDEKQVEKNIMENPIASDHRKTEDHSEERAMVESFEKNFNELRTDFKTFLSKRL